MARGPLAAQAVGVTLLGHRGQPRIRWRFPPRSPARVLSHSLSCFEWAAGRTTSESGSRRDAPRAQGPTEDTLEFPPAVPREGTKPKPVLLIMDSGRSQMVTHRGTSPTWLPCCSQSATTSGPVPPKGGRMPPSWIPGSGPVPPRWH